MSGASGVEVETQQVYEEEVEREEDEGEELSWSSDSEIGNKKKPEKADRATVEQVIDPRTRMLLYKMLNFGLLDRMNGCISTGKEANVYHATKSDGQELAIKVYKTSVLIYKDRDRYVQGDYRFKYGYCKHNPRKMVKTWAKKEMRNLLRLKSAGIRCPTPLLLKHHILVMEFIGNGGWAASRLKDAALSLDKLSEGYVEMIMAMRTLHQKCKLVHGDLSEYNMLYFEGHLYIIDVSQSVDLSHPRALDFLREDCVHVSGFFRKRGVAVMTIRELFDFIVDPSINDDSMDSYLEEVQENILARGNMVTAEEEIAESVFMQSYMPKTFNHVRNDEDDVQWTISDRVSGDMYYQKITGLTEALSISHASVAEKQLQEEEHVGGEDAEKYSVSDRHRELENGSCDEDADGESTHSEEQNLSSVNDQPTAMDRKAIRKENKKRVKEEKREARRHKIPKAGKQKKKLAKVV